MIKAFPLNQQEYSYNAQDVSYYYAGRHSGVFALDTNCQVSVVNGMNIKVSKGKGWLAYRTDFGVVFWMEEDVTLSVSVGDTSFPRWDFVCIGWETSEIKKNPTVYIKSGSPAVTPTEPTLENSADKIEICLAKIYVPSGTTTLLNEDVLITDTRADKNYCGLVGDDLRTTNLEERASNLESRATNLENGNTPAGCATKLDFKRKINGTDFDGTQDITTARWGNKRSFTIDSIEKIIDGSSNIDFSTINIQEETIVANGTYTDGGVIKKGEKKLLILKNSGDFYIQKQSIRQLVVYSSGSGGVHDVSATVLEIGNDTQKISTVRSYPCFVFIIGV